MIDEVVAEYLKIYPEDAERLSLLQKQLKANEKLYGRRNYTGHITGGAIIFSPDRAKVLLIYHPTFQRWQQPGGHWEAEEDGPWITALREAIEETGVQLDKTQKSADRHVPVHIDSHIVPTMPPKNEPRHYHHDFRYAFIAVSEKLSLHDNVIKEARWLFSDEIKDKDLRKAVTRAKQQLKLKA